MICGKYICKRTFYENSKLWAGAHNTHPQGEDALWSEVNSIFSCIAQLQSISTQNIKATKHEKHNLSLLAEKEGFEPPDL